MVNYFIQSKKTNHSQSQFYRPFNKKEKSQRVLFTLSTWLLEVLTFFVCALFDSSHHTEQLL